jgi:hypothetical protein
MGPPTSDDDPTRRVDGPGSWGPPGQGPGSSPYPGPPYPPSGHPPPGRTPANPPPGPGPDSPTTRFGAPEAQRGQTAQFPQGGAYPPAGAPGPWPPQGGYGYGGPPPGRRRSHRGLIIALVIGLVILAGVGVALIYAFTRDEGETVSSGPSASTSAAAASTASSASSSAEAGPSATGSPSSTSRTDELLATVPAEFTDCARADPAGDGDVAAVTCGTSVTRPGPEAASFYLYDDPAILVQAFAADAVDVGPMPDGETCTTAQGVTHWDNEGVEGGQIACTITDEGPVIAWTDREFGIEGVVTAPGSAQEDLAALAEWWRVHSDFRA